MSGHKKRIEQLWGGRRDSLRGMQATLDDQLIKLGSMRVSPYIGPFAAQVADWDALLNRLQDILDAWLTCQATWLYLEPVFASPDIMHQLPVEGHQFQQVDRAWRGLMEGVAQNPACVAIAEDPAALPTLVGANQVSIMEPL
jgi:dynein heavy chain, axonemal